MKTINFYDYDLDISFLDLKEVITIINKNLENKFQICTVNSEFLVESKQNQKFKNILKNANLCIADGSGIVIARELYEKKIISKILKLFSITKNGFFMVLFSSYINKKYPRCTGANLAEYLIKNHQENLNIIIKSNGLLDKKEVVKKIPKANIYTEKEISKINNTNKICLVGTGMETQEEISSEIKTGISIGIGGSIDMYCKKQKRAPLFLQKIGLEFLWRLITLKRFKRVYNATIKFLYITIVS